MSEREREFLFYIFILLFTGDSYITKNSVINDNLISFRFLRFYEKWSGH